MSFNETHAAETYKSLISISVEGLKSVLLLNGGSIIAILTYMGHSPSSPQLAARTKCSLVWFVAGLVTVGFAFVTSYLTQFALYNESVHPENYKRLKHQRYLWVTVVLVVLSLASFALGAFSAVSALSAGMTP